MKYGFYSPKMAKVCGSVRFTVGGGEVVVTTITDDPKNTGSHWGDEVPAFEVDPTNPNHVLIHLGGQLKSWRGEEQVGKRKPRGKFKGKRKPDGKARSNKRHSQ